MSPFNPTSPARVGLFVGATSGIAFDTLMEYTRQSNRPKVYIVGRNNAKLSSAIGDLKKINPQGSYLSIRSDVSLLRNVDAACAEYKGKEEKLDLLVMAPGYLKMSRQDNADGLEDTISLRYYVRMRFVHNLLPLLSSSPSHIVSIHGAGKVGKLIENDLELKQDFSMSNAAMHISTKNTLALAKIASSHPSISCIHVFPGVAVTGGFNVLSEDWVFPLRALFRQVVIPLVKLFTVSLKESGERHLFHATSARYPPSGVRDPPAAGVALPSGVAVAKGSDWKEGSGCYLLNYDGETIGDKKLLDEYYERGMGKNIWEHTYDVFGWVLGKP